MDDLERKLECLRRVIRNCREHVEAGDRRRIYSQYLRYALNEFDGLNFYHSVAAHGLNRSEVVYEHAVPHGFVMGKLLALGSLDDESIMAVLRRFYVICVITRDEDKQLNRAGLRSKMPDGWCEKTSSVFARYEVVGIKVA